MTLQITPGFVCTSFTDPAASRQNKYSPAPRPVLSPVHFYHFRTRSGEAQHGEVKCIMGCAVDGCVWSGVAQLTAFARVALDQLGETILHVFPRPDARRRSLCTITLTDASSSIRCNWHINMQELNGLTFFRETSSLLRLGSGYLLSDKYCPGFRCVKADCVNVSKCDCG